MKTPKTRNGKGFPPRRWGPTVGGNGPMPGPGGERTFDASQAGRRVTRNPERLRTTK